jgi:hypothetical protein
MKIAATLIVLLHFLVLLGHSTAHMELHIGASTWQAAFIVLVIFVGPLLAMGLLWTRLQETGIILLGLTMAGSLVFGMVYHFFVPGTDNVLQLDHGPWEFRFRTTAISLAVIEAGAVAWCGWVLKRLQPLCDKG